MVFEQVEDGADVRRSFYKLELVAGHFEDEHGLRRDVFDFVKNWGADIAEEA